MLESPVLEGMERKGERGMMQHVAPADEKQRTEEDPRNRHEDLRVGRRLNGVSL